MASAKKKTTSAKKATKKSESMRSFVVEKDRPPFMTFRVTHQTFYWVVLSALILALGVWVLTLTVKLQQVYDDIDTLQQQEQSIAPKKH
ncbi:hypothetical protein PV379_00930 [Streptomyces caniscabiei]|uniref:hypothetical protein n=1 Tax=Streptomyces caniscabiei TaxID=2746961 RepID=UPI0029AEC25A|nr:hypothetical protein [Streptomyces caniscabiei]MDX2775919.1 hypothetical protein [Streptomyces caniscabiei]